MFRLNPSVLQRLQHFLIFAAFWLSITDTSLSVPTLSPFFGLILYIVLDLLTSFLRSILEKKLTSGFISFALSLALSLLLFLLIRLAASLTALMPLPRDLLLLNFHAYLLPVLPAVITAQILRFISQSNRSGHFSVLMINLLLFSLIMNRRGWSLHLPMDDLGLSYALIFLFLFLLVLLVLSGGRKGRRLALIPALLLCLLPLAGLLPLSRLYKNESRKEGGGLLESSLFRFDFSDYLSLESSISMKDDLVFLMKMEAGTEKILTRRFILSAYSEERGFYRDSENTPETPDFQQNDYLLGELPLVWSYPEFEMTETMAQEYYLVNFDSSAFLGLNSPVSLTPYLSWDSSSFSRIYRVESRVSSAWGWDLLESPAPESLGEEDKEFLEYYTRGGERADLSELSRDIISGEISYYDKVEAIKDYLQDNYYYSLNPGEAQSGDQLSHFLFESRKGYCSYFAFSMALLCRSAGIPARVALGFWVNERSEVLNYYPVKANQAHAWVEVFFPEYGWIEFDPTSQTLAPGEDFSISPFSPREMEPYLREILENRDSLKIPTASDPEAAAKEGNAVFRFLKKRSLAFGVLLIVFLFCVFLFIRILLLSLILGRTPEKGSGASVFFHLHLYLILSRFRKRSPTESIQDYAMTLENEIPYLLDFVSSYEKIRFGLSSPFDLIALKERGKEIRLFLLSFQDKGGRFPYLIVLFSLLFRNWRSL